MKLQVLYNQLNFIKGNIPLAEKLADNSLSVKIRLSLFEKQIEKIASISKAVLLPRGFSV